MGKKYCIFSAQYLPTIGGVERYTYNIAKKLIKKGNEVVVVTSNVDNLKEHEVTEEGIEIYRLPCINLLNGRYPVLKFNKDFFRLNKLLKNIKPDLVIVNTRLYIHSLYAVRFAKKINVRSIEIEHGTNHLSVNNKLFDKLGAIFEHFLTMCFKHYCKEFYGVSEACNEWLKHFNITAKSTIYNAIDIDEINELMDNPVKSYRKDYNIKEDDIVVTFTGRLLKEKGVLSAIEAVKKINKDNKKVHLFIAGKGELEQEIKQMTNDNIILLGPVPFDNVVALLKETDIFCLPTVFPEGLPTSVLEAIACKCFVITTDRGGSKEVIINRDYGIIMNSNDSEEVYKNLVEVLNDENYMNSAIEKSYERLLENFTWERTAEKVCKISEESK